MLKNNVSVSVYEREIEREGMFLCKRECERQ